MSQKRIKSYPYTIDESGEIRRLTTKHGVGSGDVIKPQLWRGKYRVRLRDDTGRQAAFWLHTLVWSSFAARPLDPDEELCFVDGNPTNCQFDNLAVRFRNDSRAIIKPDSSLMIADTMRGLAIHGGGQKTRLYGEANPSAILTAHIVNVIRYANGRYSYQQIVDMLGGIISKSAIGKVIRGETWNYQDKASLVAPRNTF